MAQVPVEVEYLFADTLVDAKVETLAADEAINDEYRRRKPLEGRLQKKNKALDVSTTKSTKISYGRHWGVFRRAMI